MARRRAVSWLALIAALVLVTAAGPQSLAQHPSAESADGPVVIRLYVKDRDDLNAVAGQLDIWESHPDELYVVAQVQPAQAQWLQSLGYRVEIDADKTALLGVNAVLDPRFYYFDTNVYNPNGLYMVNFLQDTNAAYPGLVELLDVGDAWQALHGGYHRDIWVLRITNEDPAYGPIEDKPVFYMHGGIHAREVTIPEMAIRFIKYLTAGYNGQGGYGVDPDVTWLVNHHVTYILVTTNPDGHKVDEENTSLNRRKNLDNDDGCSISSQWGIDLNRNHSFLWGCCGGSSGSPCDDTYRGPSPASEPETQAFQEHIMSVIPDQNGPNDDNTVAPASPITTTGLLLSLHTYSDLTLSSWGFYDYGVAPNAPELSTIGHKFAYYTGYTTFEIWYEVDGSTHDWGYGKLGIPSYTFEVGPQYGTCGGFFPSYDCMEGTNGAPRNFWAETRPAFLYAFKIARTPYITAYGPDAQNLDVAPATTPQGSPVTLTANLADHRCCGEPLAPIAGAEYFIDAPGEDGAGTALAPVDGAWGETSEDGVATIDTSGLSLGQHYILVHALNDDGAWGPFTAVFLTITTGQEPEAIELAASPLTIPIVYGESTVTATLSLADGTPVVGWPVTFTTDLGSIGPATVYSDEDGRAVTTLSAGESTGTAHVSADASVLSAAVDVEFVVPDAPTAAFDTNSPVCDGQAVAFENLTTGPEGVPIGYEWAFGDGTTSTEPEPQHVYPGEGTYTVVMTATNIGGSAVASGTVTVDAVPEAGFDYTPHWPRPGEMVWYTDASTRGPTAWLWQFGDGAQSTQQNPHHAYAAAGTYTVSLRATNHCGQSAAYQQQVVVGQPPAFTVYLPLIVATH